MSAIEADIAEHEGLSVYAKERYYFSLRGLLTRLPGKLKDGFTFQQAAIPYVRSTGRRKQPALLQNDLPQEIAHIEHSDLLDLRRQAEKALLARKSGIERAAALDLKTYEEVFSFQERLLSEPPDPEHAAKIDKWIAADNHPESRRPSFQATAEDFASVLLHRLQKQAPKLDRNGYPTELRYPNGLGDQLPAFNAFRAWHSGWPWFWVRLRLPNSVLQSIFLLLLSHTGWNVGAVGSLTVDSFEHLQLGGYRLQGFKGKTDDETPVSEIPRHMKLLRKAVDLLLWNHRQLGLAGLIDPRIERRLWFGWQLDGFRATSNFINTTRMASWCERHNLPLFHASELRPLKAALTYLPQRDLEAVRILLGHQNLKTTDDYLKNTIFFRLNEAMMLEFQRRIETSITYAQGGESLLLKRALDLRHVDNALVPTGDGGACANILAGPGFPSKADNEPCAGLSCQAGLGCENYRLVVDTTTVEMALRTRLYYRSRWQSIYDVNPEAFSRLHLPRLLYIHVLLRIIWEQRPVIYENAEANLP
ncbi:hypothetical protein PQR46_20415 [Paraburkholderia sediminicola]|uniref:hypothetical protein n=1 Tax=Paraburkholderia sediminicola TaxID=458836 RepID=UPI0038BB6E6E